MGTRCCWRRTLVLAIMVGIGSCDTPQEPDRTIWLESYADHGSRGDTEGETDIAINVDNGSSNIVWAGETEDQMSGPYVCPPFVDRPHFEHHTHHYQHAHRVFKVANLGQVGTIPKARYHLATSTIDDTGQWTIGPGDLDGSCFVRYVNTGIGLGAYVGWMGWYRFWGQETSSSGPRDHATRGWGYHDSQTGAISGAGNGDWVEVVQKYLNGEGCTVGWEIWIDGRMVCDSRGYAV